MSTEQDQTATDGNHLLAQLIKIVQETGPTWRRAKHSGQRCRNRSASQPTRQLYLDRPALHRSEVESIQVHHAHSDPDRHRGIQSKPDFESWMHLSTTECERIADYKIANYHISNIRASISLSLSRSAPRTDRSARLRCHRRTKYARTTTERAANAQWQASSFGGSPS